MSFSFLVLVRDGVYWSIDSFAKKSHPKKVTKTASENLLHSRFPFPSIPANSRQSHSRHLPPTSVNSRQLPSIPFPATPANSRSQQLSFPPTPANLKSDYIFVYMPTCNQSYEYLHFGLGTVMYCILTSYLYKNAYAGLFLFCLCFKPNTVQYRRARIIMKTFLWKQRVLVTGGRRREVSAATPTIDSEMQFRPLKKEHNHPNI